MTSHDAITLLGICQGGLFALCLAALAPAKVAGVVSVVTPVDFGTHDDRLARWLQALDLERLGACREPVPGALLTRAFRMLSPLSLGTLKYIDMVDTDSKDDASTFATRVRIERWLDDAPALGPRALADFVRAFYRDNALVGGTLELNDQPIRLDTLRCPVLNVYARRDRIVPAASSAALGKLAARAVYDELVLDSGHIGAFIGEQALNVVPDTVCHWLPAQ